MPYDISWHDEERGILRIDIHGDVSWEAWYKAVDQTCERIASVYPRRVDLIYMDQVGFPKGNPLPHMKRSIELLAAQPNLGIAVTVSRQELSMLVKIVVNVILRAVPINTRNNGGYARTLEEALARIEVARKQNGARR